MRLRKLHFTFVTVIIISFNLSCGNSFDRGGNAIIYWSSNNSGEIEFAREIRDEWNKKHPDKRVKTQPVPEGQSSEEIILAAVVGGTTPDIYSNMWQGNVESYAEAGVLVALDTLKGFMEFMFQRCDSSVIEEVTSSDGHIYQIPWKINPIMQIYNKNILEELNLDSPPRTYSEYTAAAEKFKKDTDGDGYVDQWFGYAEVIVTWWQRFFDFYPLYLAASNGAPLVKNDSAAFNNEHAVEVFSFLRNLYKNNYFPREKLSARQDVFLSEVIATRFTGPWEIAHAEKFKPKGFEYGFAPIPVPDNHEGPVYTYGDPKNIVMFNTCPDPQLAWRFLRFMMNEQQDLKFLRMTNQLPRRKNLINNPAFEEYFREHKKMRDMAEQANHVRGTDINPDLKEVFDIISQEYEACVIYGTKSPEKAIKEATEQVNLLFMEE